MNPDPFNLYEPTPLMPPRRFWLIFVLFAVIALALTMRAHGQSNYVTASINWNLPVAGPVKIYDGTNWHQFAHDPVIRSNVVADWDARAPVCLVAATNASLRLQPAAIIEEFPDGLPTDLQAINADSALRKSAESAGTFPVLQSPRGKETFTAIIPRVKRYRTPPCITPLPTLSPPLPPGVSPP